MKSVFDMKEVEMDPGKVQLLRIASLVAHRPAPLRILAQGRMSEAQNKVAGHSTVGVVMMDGQVMTVAAKANQWTIARGNVVVVQKERAREDME